MQVLLQNLSTYETRAISQACMLTDTPVHRASLEMLKHLFNFETELKRGDLIPVGSVEFVRECMHIMGIEEPEWYCYPEKLESFLQRNVSIVTAAYVRSHTGYTKAAPCFIKPADQTKLFNGFVWYPNNRNEDYNEHDIEQLEIVQTLDYKTRIYLSEIVDFHSEWRFYIDDNKIIGSARYDDGNEDALPPELDVVYQMIEAMPMLHPYTLDVGRLSTGGTALVEVNDAWAIGLYGRALEPKAYLEFLGKRWQSIVKKSLTTNK